MSSDTKGKGVSTLSRSKNTLSFLDGSEPTDRSFHDRPLNELNILSGAEKKGDRGEDGGDGGGPVPVPALAVTSELSETLGQEGVESL